MPTASLMSSAGELAALATALCWTASALAFESASRRIGALSVNLIRLALASVMLAVIAAVWLDRALPLHVPPASAGWLIASGLVGLVFGDFCLFRSFVLIGARRSTLVLTATPALAALLAWPVLGERLGWRELSGMALTALGVMTAIFSRQIRSQLPDHRPALWPGVPLALGGALGQAAGLVLAKVGLTGVHPVAGTQVRLAAGVVGFALVIALTHRWRDLRSALDNRRAMEATAVGAFFGPAVGVSLSLYAVAHAPAGVAASLMALTPVFLLPIARLRGERIGWTGALGTLAAVAGVVLLTS